MGNITLERKVFGSGYTGSIEVPAGLSWMDSMALSSVASSAWQTSVDTREARRAVEDLRYDVGDVTVAIGEMESAIGLRLDAQTKVLRQQSAVLTEIRDAVLNPEKTRGAERLADATQLIENERYERALKVAEEGIDADPNNPSLFFAAGWALVGCGRFEQARELFEEARDASRGDQRSLACRQAARSAFLAGKGELAYALCRDARATAEAAEELAAANYDIAVYACADGDPDTAISAMEAACREDSRHADRAVVDPAFERAQEIRDAAARVVKEVAEEIRAELPPVEEKIASLHEALPNPPAHGSRAHESLARGVRPDRDWRALLGGAQQTLAEVERYLSQARQNARLQTMVSVLDSVAPRLSRLEADLPTVAEAVAQHDAAASLQEQLTRDRNAANEEVKRWESRARLRQKVARRRGWLWLGIVFSLIGLLIPGLLAVGLSILTVMAAFYGIGIYAEHRQESERGKARRIGEELGGNG